MRAFAISCVLLAATAAAQARSDGPCLEVLMPSGRWPARCALRTVATIVADHGAGLRVRVVWADTASAAGRLPDGVDVALGQRGRLRAAFAADLPADTAVALWWNGGPRPVAVEPFDGAARWAAVDLVEAGDPGARLGRWRDELARARDPVAVRDVYERAAADLAGRPEQLARWIEELLRSGAAPARTAWIRAGADRALAGAPRDEGAQRVAFRVRAAAGDRAAARQAGYAWLQAVKGRPHAARMVVDVLAAHDFADDALFDEALEVALAAAPAPDLALLRVAFERWARRGDRLAADRVGRRLVAAMGTDAAALNAFAWRLLTDDAFAGALDGLALCAARAMADDPSWRTYWRVDTLALACFRNGLRAEAIALQREAVAAADPGSQLRYRERLDAYVAAGAASPGR